MGRVSIGTCSGPADAALVRSAFAAHQIHVHVGGEQTANVLGGLGGPFISLDIWVDEDDAEEASALLRDLRKHDDEALAAEAEAAGEPPDGAPDASDDEADDEADDSASMSAANVEQRVDRRRSTGIVLLLSVCITFGTAHMYTRAWFRGILLAVLEVLAFRYLVVKPPVGAVMFAGCIATDLIGSLVRIRNKRPPGIPQARVRRS